MGVLNLERRKATAKHESVQNVHWAGGKLRKRPLTSVRGLKKDKGETRHRLGSSDGEEDGPTDS